MQIYIQNQNRANFLHKRTTAVRVLNPFTRVAIDLPPLAPVFHQVVKNRNSLLYMSAAVCASTTSPMTSIAVIVWFPCTAGVLSCEPGHPSWEVIHEDMELLNTLPFQGRLYGFRRLTRQIVQVYPPNPLGPVVAHIPAKFGDPVFCSYNLVDSCGRMLLVVRHWSVRREAKESWQRCAFTIFEVDASSWELLPVSSIGNLALFLCRDRCLSVSAKYLPSISRNSVYYYVLLTNPVVLHSLSNGSFERPTTLCQVHDTTKRIRPSVRPFTLADHLLTYCNHREWARGLMFHEYNCIPECFDDLLKKIRTQDSELRIPRIRSGS
uniref:KIB1-4 beta-propeller domain-containing protein n=1 Tax=Oryza punctata TaxID=4537 RepID=A0A0E0LMW5_ORYPU